jgi:adenylate cyclase
MNESPLEDLKQPKTSSPNPAPAVTDTAVSAVAPTSAVWVRIKDHKVVQWTLAYLALAYTLLHGAEMLGSTLSWSHSLLRLFTFLLILGVPVVITVSWYHGARGQRRVSGTELMIIAILLAIGGTLLWRDSRTEHEATSAISAASEHGTDTGAQKLSTTTRAPAAASIAVLAFSDLSAEGNQAYFSDGIAEEILNVLARVNGLKVASRTSSFQFRKSDLGAPIIAERLHVRHILEGSVRKAGNTVRITVQLIDASSDQHEWSETFDRPLNAANLFAIQDEIAKTVLQRLTMTVGNTAEIGTAATRRADTGDAGAYDLYLRGHSLFIARDRENLLEAAHVLKAAVAKDPQFARAWEQLGAVLAVSDDWGVNEESDYLKAALDATDMALRLEPNLSLAFAVRGKAQTMPRDGKTDWEEAFASFSTALAHDGHNATAYLWRGNSFFFLGYFDRALADYGRCLEADPAYEICRRYLAIAQLSLHRTDEALRAYQTGLEIGYINSDALFASVVARRGDQLGALGMLERQFRGNPLVIRPVFRALTDSRFNEHDRLDALALIDERGDSDAVQYGLWILKAYKRLATAKTESPIVLWSPDDPGWLKSEGRKDMMKRWGLPGYWRKHGFPPQCRPIGDSDFECR